MNRPSKRRWVCKIYTDHTLRTAKIPESSQCHVSSWEVRDRCDFCEAWWVFHSMQGVDVNPKRLKEFDSADSKGFPIDWTLCLGHGLQIHDIWLSETVSREMNDQCSKYITITANHIIDITFNGHSGGACDSETLHVKSSCTSLHACGGTTVVFNMSICQC